MIRNMLQQYDEGNLFNIICENFKLSEKLDLDIKEYHDFHYGLYKSSIINQISLITEQCKFVLVENEYTEHAWKEIFSAHYAHTTYCKSNKVMRVHFFNSNISPDKPINSNILEKSYLGYITLRPVPDFILMLSFVVPNWNVLKYNQECYIMTYSQDVHILPYKISINTCAFYAQDSVVTTCAQADILMMSTYTSKKFNQKQIRVGDIHNYTKIQPFPSKGLTVTEMLEIFLSNGCPVESHSKKKIKHGGKPSDGVKYSLALQHSTNILDSYIESGLPVIVYNANAKHVVLVIGYTNTSPKEYIIYDDSGIFLEKNTGQSSFIGTVLNKDLFPNSSYSTHMICASHRRLYLNAEEYDAFVEEELHNIKDAIPASDNWSKRSMVVDNVVLKNHLLNIVSSDNIDLSDDDKRKIRELICIDLPHYLWYTEVGLGNDSILILVGDTTYPILTTLSIFKLCFSVPSEFRLNLLTKINYKEDEAYEQQ